MRPEGVGPAFYIAMIALVMVVLGGVYVVAAGRGAKTAKVKPDDLRAQPGADAWADRESYPPAPSPSAHPTTAAQITATNQGEHPDLKHKHQCDQDCQAKRRLRAAIEGSSITVTVPGANTLEVTSHNAETPQVLSTAPTCKLCVLKGSWFYAVLDSGINSDRVGPDGRAYVEAHVSQDIKDTVTESETLIPNGSRLIGETDPSPSINLNNEAINVEWNTLRLPDGAEIPLPHFPAADVEGYEGLVDQVNHHITKTWAPAIVVSAISAALMLTQNPTYGSAGGYNSSQQATSGFAQSMGGQTTQSLNFMLRQAQPTINIRPGTRFLIQVTQDLPFDHAYEE
jgi:type IV secretory pathway VirB10-like protein